MNLFIPELAPLKLEILEEQIVKLSASLQGCKDHLQYTKDKLIDLCIRAIESPGTEEARIKLRKELTHFIEGN
jgi:hypothetical protein